MVKICMLMIRRVYLTPLRNYYYFASGIDLSTDCQLITFRALWFQHAPELSKEVGCEGKWDGSICPTGLEKSFPSNVCFFQCQKSGSSAFKWSRKLFYENSQLDGSGECFILDRTAIHITQEGCSGLSYLWRRLLMRKTQQGFIATLYRPQHASSLYLPFCAQYFLQWEVYEFRI